MFLICFFLIPEVGEISLYLIKLWLYQTFFHVDSLAMAVNGRFAQICVRLIFEKCFLIQPWSVLVTRGILWPWLFTESSHASPEYGDLKTQRFGNPFLTLSNITVSGLLWCGFPCSEEVARFAPMCARLRFDKSFLVRTWLGICHPEQYGIF